MLEFAISKENWRYVELHENYTYSPFEIYFLALLLLFYSIFVREELSRKDSLKKQNTYLNGVQYPKDEDEPNNVFIFFRKCWDIIQRLGMYVPLAGTFICSLMSISVFNTI